MVEVEQWAELGVNTSLVEVDRGARADDGVLAEHGRRALRSGAPPSYPRPAKARVIEPFRDEIHRLLPEDPAWLA